MHVQASAKLEDAVRRLFDMQDDSLAELRKRNARVLESGWWHSRRPGCCLSREPVMIFCVPVPSCDPVKSTFLPQP